VTKSRGLIRKRWQPTEIELDLVRANFATSRTEDLATACGVAYHQVAKLAERLGLRKSDAFLNGPSGGRTDGRQGAGSRFQKGQTPPNKGKKMPGHGNPETMFKKGQRPVNWMPIGSFRVAAAGYLQIKLTDTGYPPRDWVMYHRHLWQQAHGVIPDGHLVAFKPGRHSLERELITLDALELVSRGDWIKRHTLHNYPKEIVQVHQLRGAITRQINKRARAEST
jgi:hypothetical protein